MLASSVRGIKKGIKFVKNKIKLVIFSVMLHIIEKQCNLPRKIKIIETIVRFQQVWRI